MYAIVVLVGEVSKSTPVRDILLRNSWHPTCIVYVSVCVCVCLCLCFSAPMCASVLSVFVYVYVHAYVYFYVCVRQYVCVHKEKGVYISTTFECRVVLLDN